MLIRLPPQFSADRSVIARAAPVVRQPFTTELRRDLTEYDVVAYRKPIGGRLKRGIDFVVASLTSPFWGAAFVYVLIALLCRRGASVFVRDEIVGYGGRSFLCRRFQWRRPSAEIVALRPPNEAENDDTVETQPSGETLKSAPLSWRKSLTWSDVIERLPMMAHVLVGRMSLIGPPGLSREQFKDLKMARKFYASARPGLISVCDPNAPAHVTAGVVKDYAAMWSLNLDTQVLNWALRQIKARD